MYKLIRELTHKFRHGTGSKLLKLVSVSKRRLLIFFSNFDVITYDLLEDKIILKTRLSSKIFEAKALNNDEAVCTFINGQLALLSIETHALKDLAHLPLEQQFRLPPNNLEAVSNTEIVIFKQQGSFCMMTHADDKDVIIHYCKKNETKFQRRRFYLKQCTSMQFDNSQAIIFYNQYANKCKWSAKIVCLSQNWKESVIQLQSPLLVDKSIVQSVKCLEQGKYWIFVNHADKSFILEHNNQDNKTVCLSYTSPTCFSDILLLNQQLGFLCHNLLSFQKRGNEDCRDCIQMVDLSTMAVQDKILTNLDETSIGWEEDYFLNWKRDNVNTVESCFKSIYIIPKQSLYANLMHRLGINTKYGSEMCQAVLSLLYNRE